MDARTFEPDEPLPRICKHCKWFENVVVFGGKCKHPERRPPYDPRVVSSGVAYYHPHPDNTCDQWEEKA
jgi:hypothetical protein